MMNKAAIVFLPLILLEVFVTGCRSYCGGEPEVTAHYYVNSARPLAELGKVTVIEFANYTAHPQVATEFTDAVCEELARHNLFGQQIIRRDSELYHSLSLEELAADRLTLKRLESIRQAVKADAVLVGAVTRYEPYPHMTVGLHLCLFDLNDGQLLWAVQHLWDCSQRQIEQAMKQFFRSQLRSGYEPLEWRLAMVSPRHFRRFVAYQVGRTLP
jgi:hypothetical protein